MPTRMTIKLESTAAFLTSVPLGMDELALWEKRVRQMVRPRRYEHVCRVAKLARQIAHANQLSEAEVEQAYVAGILHDIARDLPNSELLRLAPPECDIDQAHPLALHGRAGRRLLEHWGYTDQVVLDAVEDHTTGPRGGSSVSACVYIADVSEPGRGVNDDIRELAFIDLGAALNRAMVSKVTYLKGRGIQVHPRTLQAYQSLPNAEVGDRCYLVPNLQMISTGIEPLGVQLLQEKTPVRWGSSSWRPERCRVSPEAMQTLQDSIRQNSSRSNSHSQLLRDQD